MKQSYGKHFFYSLLLHVVLISALVLSFEFHSTVPVLENSNKNSEIINAVIALPNPTSAKLAPKPFLPKPIKQIAETPKPVQPKKDVIAIDDKKQKQLQQEKIQQQLLADLKKQTKKEKIKKQQALEKAFEKELKMQATKTLQKQLLQENIRLAGARKQQTQGEVNKYKALILQAISQRWIVPPTVNKKLFCELLIHVAPGGDVLDVQLIKASGDDTLDRSARAAVFKASPLPVPPDSDAFEPFRQFVLKVKPENLLSAESWLN